MTKFFSALIASVAGLALIAFAVANRQRITVSFDPFSADAPALTATVPLFAIPLAALLAGVLIGGTASWVRQSRWRQRARELRAELQAERAERAAFLMRPPSGSGMPAGSTRRRLAIGFRSRGAA